MGRKKELSFDDIRQSTFVLENVAPGFVREPSAVARLRGKFSAFYGSKERPLPKAYQEQMRQDEETERIVAQRQVKRRERVSVMNVPDQVGVGQFSLSRWVERVRPDPTAEGAGMTPASTIRAHSKAKPVRMDSPLKKFKGTWAPWGLSDTTNPDRNKSPITVGYALERMQGCMLAKLLSRDKKRKERTVLPTDVIIHKHKDNSGMRPAGFRTTDRYIF